MTVDVIACEWEKSSQQSPSVDHTVNLLSSKTRAGSVNSIVKGNKDTQTKEKVPFHMRCPSCLDHLDDVQWVPRETKNRCRQVQLWIFVWMLVTSFICGWDTYQVTRLTNVTFDWQRLSTGFCSFQRWCHLTTRCRTLLSKKFQV